LEKLQPDEPGIVLPTARPVCDVVDEIILATPAAAPSTV
jgi:hypothetical protein